MGVRAVHAKPEPFAAREWGEWGGGNKVNLRLTLRTRLEVDLRSQRLHKVGMSKSPRVVFKPKRIAEGDWQIVAEYPGAEDRYIKGLKTKADIDEWLSGTRRVDWLRSQGYAK